MIEFEECRTPPNDSMLVKLGGHTLPMIQERHPRVADHVLVRGGFHLEASHETRDPLLGAGVAAPEWGDVDRGQRPGSHPDDEFHRFSRMVWQSFAVLKSKKCSLAPLCGRI